MAAVMLTEVAMNRTTGKVWPRRSVPAAHQGKVIKPLWRITARKMPEALRMNA